MRILFISLTVICFILLNQSIIAQVDSVFITGKVYDYETQEPIENATFIHNGEVVKLNNEGNFNRYIKVGDTLSFRYTGHENYTIIVDQDLEKMSYISGIFLNQQEIESSDFILEPRLHNAKSFASYDPLEAAQMMQNARHTINVASYQANLAHEWDAHDNQKYAMSVKEEQLEYKSAIAPSQQLSIGAEATIYDPLKTLEFQKKIDDKILKDRILTPDEELYLKNLFEHSKDSL